MRGEPLQYLKTTHLDNFCLLRKSDDTIAQNECANRATNDILKRYDWRKTLAAAEDAERPFSYATDVVRAEEADAYTKIVERTRKVRPTVHLCMNLLANGIEGYSKRSYSPRWRNRQASEDNEEVFCLRQGPAVVVTRPSFGGRWRRAARCSCVPALGRYSAGNEGEVQEGNDGLARGGTERISVEVLGGGVRQRAYRGQGGIPRTGCGRRCCCTGGAGPGVREDEGAPSSTGGARVSHTRFSCSRLLILLASLIDKMMGVLHPVCEAFSTMSGMFISVAIGGNEPRDEGRPNVMTWVSFYSSYWHGAHFFA